MKVDLDLAPVASAALHREVPVIDLRQERSELVTQVGDACRDWGFFQIVGHSIGEDRIAEVIATARAFFARPRDEKRRCLRSRDNPWG